MNVSKLYQQFAALVTLTEQETLAYCHSFLSSCGYVITTDAKGEVYLIAEADNQATVALVAHCDTVAKKPPRKLRTRCGRVDVKGGGVLGADDRAGIAGILSLVTLGYRPSIYLTTQEEVGGVGAKQLAKEHTPPDSLRVLIQLDRRGACDYVTYDCDSKPLNKWVENFGWENATGSFSDISTLCPQWGIAGVNLSTGYYQEHQATEHLILPHLAHTVERVAAMLLNPPNKRIVYEEAKRFSYVRYSSSVGNPNSGYYRQSSNGFYYSDDWEWDNASRRYRYRGLNSGKTKAQNAATTPQQPATSPEPLKPLADAETREALPAVTYVEKTRCENCGEIVPFASTDARGWCFDCRDAFRRSVNAAH